MVRPTVSMSSRNTKTINLTLLILLRTAHRIARSPAHLHARTFAPLDSLQSDCLCNTV